MVAMLLDLIALPLFQRALITGLILSLLMAILGVLVVIRRLSFFADAIGHSALTGIAAGLLLSFYPFATALAFTLAVATGIALARRSGRLHLDTLLGVSYPAAVALGVILIRFLPGYQTDLLAVLFGDILTISWLDAGIALGLAVVGGALLFLFGKAQVTIALDESLAHAEGIAVFRQELLLLLVLAAVITMAVKLVGIVLVTAMLVIPAASAQNMAWSLKSMLLLSLLFSAAATVIGMLVSVAFGTPSGPTIVLASAAGFALSFAFRNTARP